MGKAAGAATLDTLKSKAELALAIAEEDGLASVGQNLRFVLASVGRLLHPPAPSDVTVALKDVCRFLEVRGEGLSDKAFERKVRLPHETFEWLEVAAGKQDDVDQIQYALAGALQGLPRGARMRRLLTSAAALGKKIALEFGRPPEVALQPITGAHLPLADACRVVEQLFRFTNADDVVRVTGVPREMVDRMDSAAASAGKMDG